MIYSKPKRSTLFPLMAFMLLTLLVVYWALGPVLQGQAVAWYSWLVGGLVALVFLTVAIKTITDFKHIQVGQGSIKVRYPLILRNKAFETEQLAYWSEAIIKTKSGVYKQLELHFEAKKRLSISLQQNTEYDKIKNYLDKKYKARYKALKK